WGAGSQERPRCSRIFFTTFFSARCADLSRDAGQWSPQLGLREACRSAVQPETRAEAPPVLIVDMVDTPRFIRIIAWLLAPFILMGAALIVWGLRQRSRSAPQTVGFP